MQIPFEIDAVGYFRHQSFGKTHAPVSILIFNYQAVSIAARVGGVVVGAVVVDGPVRELEMAVAADRVDVEEVRHAELPRADFNVAYWQFCCERKWTTSGVCLFLTDRDDLMDHQTSHVWL